MSTSTHSRARLHAIRADELLPGAVVCRRLGISRNTLYGPLRKMGLEPVRFGKRYFYDGAEIVECFRRLAAQQRGGDQ